MFSIFTHAIGNPYVTQIASLDYPWFHCAITLIKLLIH